MMTKTRMMNSSLDAYYSKAAKLQANEEEVLRVLQDLGPLTNRELSDALGWKINRITGRTNSLRKKGLLVDAGKVKDPLSKIAVHKWKVA
jgi:DNA-binding MarR family transcriptional regulator